MTTGSNTKNNYYAFGMPMPGRSYQISNGYRYGMNGQEKDLEIAEGIYTAMYWEYDSRLGRRWNMDPKPTATESSYSCFSNSPILKNDVNGDTTHIYTTAGVYKGTILDKLKTNEVVLMTESQANSVLGLQGGKYSEEIVAIVARDPKIASARMTENTVKELTKFSTSSPQENSGLMYADKVTKEVKLDKAKNKPSDHPIIGGEADPQELGALEKSTSSKGNIIGYFHTHPENTLFGSQPSESDFTGGGYVDALQNGGIGAIVTKGKVGLFPLTNMGTGITPQVKDRKPNGSLFPTSNHNAVFNKKVSPQYIKK